MSTKELNYNELQELLSQNIGTENYWKPSFLDGGLVYTDGVKMFHENAGGQGAYWFIQMVCSYMTNIKVINAKTGDNFFTVHLKINKPFSSWDFEVAQENPETGKNKIHIQQGGSYTDLQQDDSKEVTEYKFYLIKDYTGRYVLMLPSEY